MASAGYGGYENELYDSPGWYGALGQYAPTSQRYGASVEFSRYDESDGRQYAANPGYGDIQRYGQLVYGQKEHGLPLGADRALAFPRDYAAQSLRPRAGYGHGGQGTVTDQANNWYQSFGVFGDGHLRTRGEGGLKK